MPNSGNVAKCTKYNAMGILNLWIATNVMKYNGMPNSPNVTECKSRNNRMSQNDLQTDLVTCIS